MGTGSGRAPAAAVALSPEFRLIAACCAWPPTPQRDSAIQLAVSPSLNWAEVLRLVARHRVAGLVKSGLSRTGAPVPPAVNAQLAAAAARGAKEALGLAAESLRLGEAFTAAGVPSLNLKGSSLAVLAYGNIAIKQAWDIDVIVPSAMLGQAIRVLEQLGYERVSPPSSLSNERFEAWITFAHEAIFQNVARGTFVELHWRLTDNATTNMTSSHDAGRQRVAIAGDRYLETLGDRDLFNYLCLHGAHHAWGRLKWLADLAAWLAQKTPDQIEDLYRNACRSGARRAAEQGLQLCEVLLGLELPATILQQIGRDLASRWLLGVALDTLKGPESELQGSLKVEVSQFLLAPTLSDLFDHLKMRLIGWTDFHSMPLPRQLYFLYPLIRFPSWFWRRVWHAQ